MLRLPRLLTSFKIFVIGLLATLAVVFVVCGIVGAGHANETGCVRMITSTGSAVTQRGFGMLIIVSLASLFVVIVFSLTRPLSNLVSNKLMVPTRWQQIFREIILIAHDFLRKAFRRGIVHGQVYSSAFVVI